MSYAHSSNRDKPRAGPALRPGEQLRALTRMGNLVALLLPFASGLAFAGWLGLRHTSSQGTVACAALLGVVGVWWLIGFRSLVRSKNRQGLVGSSLVAVGASMGLLNETVHVAVIWHQIEFVLEVTGVVLSIAAFDRWASTARLRAGLDDDGHVRSACDSVTEPMVVIGSGCRVRQMNWLAELSFGQDLRGSLACETPFYRRDSCQGCPVAACFDTESPQFFVARVEAASPTKGAPSAYEFSTFPVVRDGVFLNRQILRVTDVSSRESAERHLQFLGYVVESIADAVIGLDLAGNVSTANASARRLLSSEDGSLAGQMERMGRPFLDLVRFAHAEDRAEVAFLLEDSVNRNGALREVTLLTRTSEEEFDTERRVVVSAEQVRDDEGRGVGVVVIVRDVTEARRVTEQLRQAEKMSVLGSFVSGLAHELNNPLMAIHGKAEQLIDDGLSDRNTAREAVQSIHDSAGRCERIVTGLLRFARKDGGAKAEVDVDRVVEQVLDLTGHALARDGIRLRFRRCPQAVRIDGDETLLVQVLMNLLSNAHHSMRRSGSRGTIDITTKTEGGDVVLEVADEGEGLRPDVMRRMFERFFTTKKASEGTGLGLTLAQEIVQEHGGSLNASNRPSRGALFTIRLPVLRTSLAPAARAQSLNDEWAPLRVLVIDDEPAIREVLKAQIGRLGHGVEVADSFDGAIAALNSEPVFDVVMCDFGLGRRHGSELYERAVAMQPGYEGRFVFVTGDVDADVDGISKQGNLLLTKPVNREQLEEALRTVHRNATEKAERARTRGVRALS